MNNPIRTYIGDIELTVFKPDNIDFKVAVLGNHGGKIIRVKEVDYNVLPSVYTEKLNSQSMIESKDGIYYNGKSYIMSANMEMSVLPVLSSIELYDNDLAIDEEIKISLENEGLLHYLEDHFIFADDTIDDFTQQISKNGQENISGGEIFYDEIVSTDEVKRIIKVKNLETTKGNKEPVRKTSLNSLIKYYETVIIDIDEFIFNYQTERLHSFIKRMEFILEKRLLNNSDLVELEEVVSRYTNGRVLQ